MKIVATLAGLALLAGCTPVGESGSSASDASSPTASAMGSAPLIPDSIDQVLANSLTPNYSEDDLVWDRSAEVGITLSDSGSSGGDGVSVDGSVVTVTKPGTYRVAGTLSDGQLAVDSTGVVRLILDTVSITNNSSSALVAKGADKLIIITSEDTANTLTDATAYSYPDADTTEPDAALFSSVDTVFGGDGELAVNGRATDAITSKDGLVIASGTIDVTAVDDGIKGRDYLVVSDGTITATTGGQGLKSTQDSDSAAGYILVSGGTIDVTTTGSSSDCVNAVTSALFTAGTLTLSCTDDAIHADKLVMVEGGDITVTNTYEGLESAAVVITGGKIDVTSSDDAINATDGSGAGNPGGGRPGGTGGTGGFPGGGATPGRAPDGQPPSGGQATPGGFPSGNGPQPGGTPDAAPSGGFGGGPGGAGGRGGAGGGGGFAVENATVVIRGGEITLQAGGDGIDSNGTIAISGGTTIAAGANRAGDGALDSNGSLQVSGGIVAAIGGSSRMLKTPDENSPQQWFSQTTAIEQGDTISITTRNGTFTFTASEQAQNIVFSSPDLAAGATLTVGGGSAITPECHGG